MTNEDLKQHADAWTYAATNFAYYEKHWSGSSLQTQATANRRLCEAVAEGYKQQIKNKD